MIKEKTPSILSYNTQNLCQCLFVFWSVNSSKTIKSRGTKLVRLSYTHLYEML